MHSLRFDAGQLLQESAEIRQCAVYQKLFRSEFLEHPRVLQSFHEDLPKISVEANAELEAEISAEELREELQSLESVKAPGIDGLPADCDKAFWPVIGGDLLSVLRDSHSRGQLPLSCRRAVLTLLPK